MDAGLLESHCSNLQPYPGIESKTNQNSQQRAEQQNNYTFSVDIQLPQN